MPSLTSLAMAVDPVMLATEAGFQCDPWQTRMLRSDARRQLLCASRQSGKSTVTAIKAVHTAVFVPESLILLLSPTLRQSSELFKRCMDVYRSVDDLVPPVNESALRIELKNSSRILSLPGAESTVRGYSPTMIIIDEASRVEDELYLAIRASLAVTNGKLILLSTPFGTRGFFYEEYKRRDQWEYYAIKASDCPRISQEFLEEEKATLGEWWFKQEYEVQFLDSQGAAFRSEDLARVIQSSTEAWEL